MAAIARGEKESDIVGGTPFDLNAAQAAKGKSRAPEILVGTFLVALFALAGAWFYSTSTQSDGYLALRLDVERGDLIDASHLTNVELTTDAQIIEDAHLRDFEASQVIGQVALADMKIGTLVTSDQFADRTEIPSGSAIVGLDLDRGRYPSERLGPGDFVRVVLLPDSREINSEGGVTVLVERAEVVEIDPDSSSGYLISLTMSSERAEVVTAAASADRVSIIQVPGG